MITERELQQFDLAWFAKKFPHQRYGQAFINEHGREYDNHGLWEIRTREESRKIIRENFITYEETA